MHFPENIWERVQNIAIYFVENCEKVDPQKLEALFYLLDEKTFLDTAFTMTDQEYHAEERGPVPYDPVTKQHTFIRYHLNEILALDEDGYLHVVSKAKPYQKA